MKSTAVSCTHAMFDAHLVADPTWEEESHATSAVTYVMLDR